MASRLACLSSFTTSLTHSLLSRKPGLSSPDSDAGLEPPEPVTIWSCRPLLVIVGILSLFSWTPAGNRATLQAAHHPIWPSLSSLTICRPGWICRLLDWFV